jgi:tetratricopeptide (TPR) repeat protein
VKDTRRRNRPLPEQGGQVGGPLPRRAERAGRGIAFGIIAVVVVIVALSCWRLSHPAADRVPRSAGEPTAKATAPRASDSSTQQTLEIDAPVPTTVPALMEEAEQVVGRLVQRFPRDPYALDCAAKAHLYLGHTTEAAEYWDRCLQSDSQAAFAHEGLGRVAGMKSDYEEAVRRFRTAIELFPASSDTSWLADTACQLADTLMKLGRTEQAVDVLERNIRVCPDSAKSHLLLGQLRLQSREFEKARQSFEETIRIQPESSQAHFGLATALRRTGEQVKSAQSMKIFQELNAKKSKVRTRMKFQEEEPEELAAKVAMTYTHAGQIYEQHGDLPGAERHWRRAALLSQTNVAARVLLAAHYVKTTRPVDAIKAYKELTAIEPANPMHHWQLAMLHVRMGQFEPAEAALETVMKLSPESAQGYVALAELYEQSGQKLAAAKRLAEEAVRIDPVAPHYALLSRVCARAGDEAGALQAARKAKELGTHFVRPQPPNGG